MDEHAVYVMNLETLVRDRTTQLLGAVAESERLLSVLKQILAMESLEQVRRVVQAAIGA